MKSVRARRKKKKKKTEMLYETENKKSARVVGKNISYVILKYLAEKKRLGKQCKNLG